MTEGNQNENPDEKLVANNNPELSSSSEAFRREKQNENKSNEQTPQEQENHEANNENKPAQNNDDDDENSISISHSESSKELPSKPRDETVTVEDSDDSEEGLIPDKRTKFVDTEDTPPVLNPRQSRNELRSEISRSLVPEKSQTCLLL